MPKKKIKREKKGIIAKDEGSSVVTIVKIHYQKRVLKTKEKIDRVQWKLSRRVRNKLEKPNSMHQFVL